MATFVMLLYLLAQNIICYRRNFRDTDIAAIQRRRDIVRHDHEINDFSDTAALCSHMDLVVSVDTSVAHLAGAIGKRTMLMLPWWPDWRWGLDVATNIWYPNMMSCARHSVVTGAMC